MSDSASGFDKLHDVAQPGHVVTSGRPFYICFNVLFVCYFALLLFAEMGPRRAVQQEEGPIDVASIHPLYQFPQNIPRPLLTTYENRLGWLYNREFAIAPIIDWGWLGRVGMVVELERYWSKTYVGDQFSFTCHGWRNLFAIQEPVFRELSVEFFFYRLF